MDSKFHRNMRTECFVMNCQEPEKSNVSHLMAAALSYSVGINGPESAPIQRIAP